MKKATIFAIAIVVAATMFALPAAAAENTTGVVIDVATNSGGGLTGFTIVDSAGNPHAFGVAGSTEFGLEDRAGSLWNARVNDDSVEAAQRLGDHQLRFAPLTVVAGSDGVAITVTESEPRNLDTNLGYVGAAFLVLWLFVFAYIFWIGRKQARLNAKLNTSS